MVLRRVVLALLAALLLLAAVLFVLRNAQVAPVDLLGLRFESPLWVLMLGAFVAGALCCGAALAVPLLRANLGERRARKALAQMESELHALRNAPPAEQASAPPELPEQGESSGGAG
ncbi:MAG: LapA family protein [Deltaproteobacteria bacterium]|nr:LapA family protein [Deltaproteobacteria bacterium]